MEKRLARSSTNHMISGVCGGIAEYWNIDPVIVRVIFFFLILSFGAGLLLYVVLRFVMPYGSPKN